MNRERPTQPTHLARASEDTLLAEIRSRTPARLFAGRAGASYRTQTLLELREDHAAALDAVQDQLDLGRDLGEVLVREFGLVEVATKAASKLEYLRRPDMGRELSEAARSALAPVCPLGTDLQVVIGDGLSAAAVRAQVPSLLALLHEKAQRRRWTWGRPFFVRHCRVGVLNEIGDLLDPAVAVLLIGERPGLATAESLSAYMAYRPRAGHTDAQRNLISNIHARGVSIPEAAERIANLAEKLMREAMSGFSVKEERFFPARRDWSHPSHPTLLPRES
jgi:ethanolamine ammonia-lyase small subunit